MKLWGLQNPWVDLPETTDFVALAKAQGVDGERVTDPNDLEAAFKRALEPEGSYIVDVFTDPETRIRRALRDVLPILSDRKRSEEHTSELQSLMRNSYAVFCLTTQLTRRTNAHIYRRHRA